MTIFQSSVVTKHLKTQNKQKIAIQWELFKNHFHNPTIQEDIRSLKEEQYQGEFLEDFFVKILGYTKPASSSETKFNLTTEYKNIKDSKKADGAIIINGVVKAVIELKGTNTTDLGKIEVQAFGYKNNQPECTYVITSNFEKLRFYIDNAIEHIEFSLFTLTEKDFELLYLCLSYENIEKNIPKKLKEESLSQEDAITKKLYNDYSLFKRELHQSLVILNPQFDALTLFQKSQKLLDRFLFLFFAEDRQLLPPNSVRLILDQWQKLKELDAYTPLFDRFKKYFGYLNTGHKGKQYDVYAYNGGLFLPDEVLDTITIDDDLLYKHTLKLSGYDFISEVDVNILGHIFENSLNELDEIKAQLAGETIDKSKTKRKKDGVFYTPKYITKYIVENTVGKLCEEKKTELEIVEEEFVSTRGLTRGLIPLPKKKKQQLLEKLSNYRNWLLQLTICDPACGSGAFLNQALDFLISEHRYIDELQAKLFGDAMVLSDVEKGILEHNLFGVDLNEESVEIAKLSLWLRTAQPNRKLNDLNNNIKCGNSLIDDPEIAGEKAFNWQQEFPQIFKEKNKKAFHITTAVHDSRTSERMIEYKVREKRDLGTNPYPNISYFTEEDEFVITQTIANIVKEDNLNVLAYNICADHIHLLLVCEEEEITKIVQKIKSITSKICTQNRTSEHTLITREHAPLPLIQTMEHAPLPLIQTMEHAPLPDTIAMEQDSATREHAPLPDTKKEITKPLWTQKFGCKEITTEAHLFTAIDYIKHNRSKHNLPQHCNKGFKPLVESINCSYEHAFRHEYKGGFDVVIGNPPYVVLSPNNYIKYNFTSGNNNTYIAFFELGLNILKQNGELGFITPNTWFGGDNFEKFRTYIISKINLREIIQLPYDIFQAYIDTSIIFLNKKSFSEFTKFYKYDIRDYQDNIDFTKLNSFPKIEWLRYGKIFLNVSLLKIGEKVWFSNKNILLEKIANINRGSLPPNDKEKSKIKTEYNNLKWFDNQIFRYKEDVVDEVYVNYNSLRENKNLDVFKGKRIFARQLMSRQFRMNLSIVDYDCAFKKNLYIIYDIKNNFISEFILAVLNSRLFSFTQVSFNTSLQRDDFPAFSLRDFKNFSIPNIALVEQQPFVEKANLMLSLNKELQEQSQKFQRTLEREFFDKGFKPLANNELKPLANNEIKPLANNEIKPLANKGLKPLANQANYVANPANSLPKKLQDWYLLSYGDFIKELEKKKVKLSLSQKAEWEDYFLQESKKALALKNNIDTTDKEIDAMVYELYGLTKEEIEIVEKS